MSRNQAASHIDLPAGTLVQVIQPAADGTTGMVGMIGMVVPFEDGDACEIPDPGGVPVYFHWPDDGLHGRFARSRLRVVGHSEFVPVGPWDRRGEVTVENDRIVRKAAAPPPVVVTDDAGPAVVEPIEDTGGEG